MLIADSATAHRLYPISMSAQLVAAIHSVAVVRVDRHRFACGECYLAARAIADVIYARRFVARLVVVWRRAYDDAETGQLVSLVPSHFTARVPCDDGSAPRSRRRWGLRGRSVDRRLACVL
jgi:hypothetical protein